NLTLVASTTPTQNFSLTATTSGSVAENVSIAGADSETFVTTSFRQPAPSSTDMIEIFSINVANGSSVTFGLDTGNYTAVSSTFSQTTQSAPVTVGNGTTANLPLNF